MPEFRTRGEQQSFIMRQTKAAKAVGMSLKDFRESYGDIDYVPRDADMDPPVVQHTIQGLRNQFETKRMNPITKFIGLKAFDLVFSNKAQKNIQKWADMQYYWKAFRDLFSKEGKKANSRMRESVLRQYVQEALMEERKKL